MTWLSNGKAMGVLNIDGSRSDLDIECLSKSYDSRLIIVLNIIG